MDDGWVEMLVVVRCLRANVVDNIWEKTKEGESWVTGAVCI